MAIALFLNLKRKGEISVNFLYELLLKIVSIARGYIPCPAGSVQNNTYQNRKAPFEESGAETSSEADIQRTKGRRYRFIRIAFIIFIILLCLILAFASPLRCFALGYASETIVELILSALAGTAAYAFAAAGGAELIACLLIGMGASITVSVIAAAINTAVECGAWQDFVINCQNNFEIRKNQGTMALAMGGTAFLYAYDWVKQHILGISEEEDTGSSVPTFTGMECLGSSIWSKDCHENKYEKEFEYKGLKITDIHHMMWNKGNRITHKVRLTSGNAIINFQAPQVLDTKLRAESSYDYPTYDISINHYSPIFTSTSAKIGTSFKQVVDKNEINQFHKVQELKVVSCFFINQKNEEKEIKLTKYDSVTKMFFIPYSSNERCICLIKKDGTIVTEFDSVLDFAYQFLYKASYYGEYYVNKKSLYWSSPLSSTAVPIAIPLENQKYYDKDRDTIATTAGSVRTKVKDGSITSDTDGKVTVKVNSPAIPTEGSPAIVTPETKINEPVKVTDISTTLEGVQTMNPGDAITIGSNNIELGAQPMGDKLPFSALKTISNMMNTLFISKTDDNKVKAPVIPVDFKVMNQHIKFNIDFSPLDPYVGLVRIGLSVSFLITTYLCFKKWIVNKEL